MRRKIAAKNNIVGKINTEKSGNYQVNSLPILRIIPFVKKITISEIKDYISSNESFISVVHQDSSIENNKIVKIKIENH